MDRYGLSRLTALHIRSNQEGNHQMPSMKTKKSATKRMKMSATGKVLRTQGGKSHLNGYKTRSRKRNLRGTTVTVKEFTKTARRMLQGN